MLKIKNIDFGASPIWQETFDIPNLTKAVQNLTLTAGFKSYGVKFDLNPLSVQEDVVIFESLTSNFATQSIVYTGTSTNVTIQASSYAPRWVKVRSRDKWDDLNISEATAGPVTPLNSEVDTFVVPGAPTNVVVAAFNEISDPSNYTGYINASWAAPATGAKGYNVGVWESTPGATLPSREFKVDGTSSKIDGLFVGKSYYIQVKSLSEFSTPSAWVPPALNYPVVIPGNTAIPGAVTISGTAAPKSIVFTWSDPASNAALVTSGGYYEVKLYTNSAGTGSPLETRKAWSNQASFSGLTTGTQYWATVQPYTSGSTPVAGTITAIYGPLVPTAIDNPDLKGDFILANNQLQVGGTSNANDIHLSAYTKAVPPTGTPGSLPTYGRIYIGGPETSTSVAVGLYNDSGTPFYADNYGRFSLGDKLTWSGNLATPVLDVKGTIEVTGPSTFSSYVLSGATNSAFIGIGKQVPYRVSSVEQSGTNGLTGIVINKSGAAVNSDYIKSDGTFRLGEGGLTYNGTQLNLIGNIQAAGGTFTGNLRVTTGSIVSGGNWAADGTVSGARVVMQSGGLYAHDTTGAQSVFIQASDGLIDARKGYVGGWTINATSQTEGYIQSSNTKIESSGNITLGNQIGSVYPIVRLSATDNFRLWVGSNSSSNAPFKVSKEGILYAEGAVLGLGAGSSIPGYVQGDAIDFTLKTVTSGINQRLGVVEGDYVPALTLTTGLATKNTVFVTTDSTQPFANKAGDLWINGGDQNSLWTATGAGQNWTEKPNGKLALKTSLNAKLNASTYIVQSAVDNKITADATGLEIFSGSASSGVKFTGSGLYGYKNSLPTFSIDNNGNAQFTGEVSATSGYFGTSLSVGWMISGGELLGNTPSGTGYSQISLNANTGTISGGKITGTVLQGSLIRTSTNSRRVEMSDASDSFRVLNSGYQGHVTALTDGIMMHYTTSSTPSSTATTYGLVLLKSNYATLIGDATHYFEANGVSNIVNIMGTVININAGSSGIVFSGSTSSDRGKVYFEKTTTGVLSPSTTTSSANTFLNSSTGLIARSTSSRRYKTNIESVEFTDDQLLSLRPVKFQGISDLENGDNAYRVGLIAEEVAEIQGLEDIVEYNEDGNPENISYNSLAPILISVVKRVLSRLDALEAK